MDPVAASILVSLVTSLAEHAPEVAMMLTGTETPEQAIERAHAAVSSVQPLGERISAAADKRRAELAAARTARGDEKTQPVPTHPTLARAVVRSPLVALPTVAAPRIDLGDDEGGG